MKTIQKLALALCATALCLTALASCGNPAGQGAPFSGALESGTGAFTLRLASSRTILPATPALGDFTGYTLAFTPTTGGAAINANRTNATLATSPVILPAGHYNLAVTASNGAGIAARGTLDNIEITSGGNTAETVTLNALLGETGTTGTFSWNVTLGTGSLSVSSATMTIKNSGGAVQGSVETLNTSGASTGTRSLPSGSYTVTFDLKGADNKSLLWHELLYVYSALESPFAFTFTDAHFTQTHWNITFDANGGSGGGTQSVLHGAALPQPGVPVKTLYAFEDWYTDPAFSGSPYAFSAPVTGAFTLYAKWLRDLGAADIGAVSSVTYNGSSHEPTPTVEHDSVPLTHGTHYTLSYSNNTNAGLPTASVTITAITDSGTSGSKTVYFTIDPKPVTISGVTATSRDYESGNTAVTTSGGTLSGVETVDSGNVAPLHGANTGTMADANAGTGKAVTTDITLTGTAAGNYTLTQPTNVTVTINKAPGAAVTAPTEQSVTAVSITVNAASLLTATGQSIEYNISKAGDGTGFILGTWQAALSFSGLDAGTVYYVYARSASNANYETGAHSVSAAITTLARGTFTITDAVITDAATDIASGITLSRSGGNTGTITLQNSGAYSSYRWIYNGADIGTGASITLGVNRTDASIPYNVVGTHLLTLRAVKGTGPAAVPYSVKIQFAVTD